SSYAFAVTTNLSSVTLPEGLETIGYAAFNESGLQSINFPSSLKTIEGVAFRMTKLVSVTVPETVENFGGASTFNSCSELVYVKLPNSATRLEYTFTNCAKLQTVILGNAVTFIEEWSFAECTSLRNIEIATVAPPETRDNSVFSQVPLHLVKLKVPIGAKPAYSSTSYAWSGIADIGEKQF